MGAVVAQDLVRSRKIGDRAWSGTSVSMSHEDCLPTAGVFAIAYARTFLYVH
jgi:hypothetical protein